MAGHVVSRPRLRQGRRRPRSSGELRPAGRVAGAGRPNAGCHDGGPHCLCGVHDARSGPKPQQATAVGGPAFAPSGSASTQGRLTPLRMAKTFYITTPIYYVNDVPHIGHAYTTIAADVLARYHRLKGYDVFFLTGLDEHGQKVQQAAQKAAMDPQAYCDRLAPQFQTLWKRLNISNDAFIRTTDPQHKAYVQRTLQALSDKKQIYRADYTGWYCTFNERFWRERGVADGLCPDCKRPADRLSQSTYFSKMGPDQNRLE